MAVQRRSPAHGTGQPHPVTDLIGEATRAEIFGLVLTAGPVSRTVLAERLNLSPSTVTRLLPPLLQAGYLLEEAGQATGPGRPQRMLRVNLERHLVAGVKIAPTHVTGVVTDMGARVLARDERPLRDCTPAVALASAADLVTDLLSDVLSGRSAEADEAGPEADPEADRVLGLGVGLGGHVDPVSGILRYSGILGWRDVDVAGPLAAATGLRVCVGNDVNTLVVAERWFGKGRDVDTFAVVTIGAGVGCGLLLGGALFTGVSGLAAEFGHIPLDATGPECTCGRRGCLEALASSHAILGRLHQLGVHCADIGTAADLARDRTASADGRMARAAFAAAGEALGRGLAALCNLLNPEMVIIAGEGVNHLDLMRPSMDEAFDYHAFSSAASDCAVLVDPVNDDPWARGAACLVIRETVRAPLS